VSSQLFDLCCRPFALDFVPSVPELELELIELLSELLGFLLPFSRSFRAIPSLNSICTVLYNFVDFEGNFVFFYFNLVL